MKLRRASQTRKAFEAVGAGAHVPIALDGIFGVNEVSGPKKLGRMLVADGDLNPGWAVLDAILDHDPAAVLGHLCAAYGFETPQRRANDLALLMDAVLRELVQIQAQFNDLGGTVERVAELLPKRAPFEVTLEQKRANG